MRLAVRRHAIAFPPVSNASGAQGFFGEGYPFHRFWKLAGLNFRRCSFVAKTTGVEVRLNPAAGQGNMPLKADGITPQELIPACIITKPYAGVVLNAVGLSGPGVVNLLCRSQWQVRPSPFRLSFMSALKSPDERQEELREFVRIMYLARLDQWRAPIGLELNFSCPNVGLDPGKLINEVGSSLDIVAPLGIPVQVKYNALVPPRIAAAIAQHETCQAITMGNTIPWLQLPHRIPWKELFGTDVSPLAHLGGGGLSGKPLLPIICDWIREAKDCSLHKPILACGGIDSLAAVQAVKQAGAAGLQLGTVGILRPWRMRAMVALAYDLFDQAA